MISLNLLSQEKKKEISKQLICISLQYLISCILIAVCTAGIALLGTKFYMQNAFNEAVREGILVTQEYGSINQKVHSINRKVDFLANIQKNYIVWSPRLAAFTELIPGDIAVRSLNISHATGDIQITGLAKTRDSLLLFKQNIEQSSLVKNINIPIDNLLQSENVDFNMQGKIAF